MSAEVLGARGAEAWGSCGSFSSRGRAHPLFAKEEVNMKESLLGVCEGGGGGRGVYYRFLKGWEIEKAMRGRTRGLKMGIVLLQKYQCG